MRLTLTALALTVLLAACSGASKELPTPPVADDLATPQPLAWWSRAAMNTFMRWSVWAGNRSGYITLFARDGVLVHSDAVGFKDVASSTPMGVDTHVRIASMTKPITAVVVMTLVEEGRLGLDDRVSDYLPAFSDLSVATSHEPATDGSYPSQPAEKPLLIRHLLMFSSGVGPGMPSLGEAPGEGDALLQLVAEELKAIAGPEDVVARLGGDEFLICHLEKPGSADPDWFGRSLLHSFAKPQVLEGKRRQVGLSIGYAHYPDDGRDIDQLMRHADLALYQAKSDPSAKCVRFRDRMRRLRDEHRAIKKDLERALQKNEFILYYQPIACTRTDKVVSGEALLRWQHPERGMVGPDDFIKIAEDAGLIDEIGTWVAEQVAHLQHRLHNLQYAVPLALNVSPRQLSDSSFLSLMQSLPLATGCDPSDISLEITESVILGDIPNARETLTALKHCGYQIVIDDFGTGYSNLAYLHNYPIDGIKIDRMFMEDIGTGGEIVKLILSLANALGAGVVAEGVETIEQRSWLSQNGCNRYQGYLYSRPVPEERFLSMLETQSQIAAM